MVPDSRKMDDFGEILANAEAVAYLERTDRPSFEMARRLAGGDVNELRRLVDNAADSVEESLSRAHLHTEDAKLQMAVERLRKGCDRLFELFPRGTPGPRS